jgi:hypothetical protein
MRPPDAPVGATESDWAHVIQAELDSWDTYRLSTRFEPRRRSPAALVWRPLPLVLAALIVAVLTATALAGGPRGLTVVIANLAGGHPQPTATPQPHVVNPGKALNPADSASTPGGDQTPEPAQTPLPQTASGDGNSRAAGSGNPGSLPNAPASPPSLPQVRLPQPSGIPDQGPHLPPVPSLPPIPSPPTLPPIPILPPIPGGGHPTPLPTPPPTPSPPSVPSR